MNLFRRRPAPERLVTEPDDRTYEPVFDPDAPRWVIAGLGNPGARYDGTRHNIGAVVVEETAGDHGVELRPHKSGCLVAESVEPHARLVLARPTTYMNESGRPLRALMDFYKVDPANLIVVHDELDIPFGDIRVKFGGGVAGHNGLRSVAQHLGSKDFARVRFGISRPPGRMDPADYVLRYFSKEERVRVQELVAEAQDAVARIPAEGVERAMNHVNTRR